MSETRKALEQQAQGAEGMLKIFKIMGWTFIGLGAVLCITIVGIPVGLMLILMGFVFVKLVPGFLKGRLETAAKAGAEQAEIHEFNLAKAREAREQEAAK